MIYKVECLYVSEFVCLLPINLAPLGSTPHINNILNRRDPRSALVHNSFALLRRKFRIEEPEVSSSRSVRYALEADKKRKLKLEISNA